MTHGSIVTRTAFAALSLVAGTTFCTGIASAEEVAAPAPRAAVSVPAAMDRDICVKTQLPGSVVPRTLCATRGEWISTQGVDPVAAK
ncbi:hypothetical protein [Sphingomonas sp.]|uniref:hypothetical protein n=1 Tax=Sphingomonas sp. TaxID=28214 RepID=UPI002CDBDFBF|nr:hypothetical protein [Sphingomonas sp.]HTG37401.1 hypothetical protein [Sphingomonas sp.]